jgi:hypothetical protein
MGDVNIRIQRKAERRESEDDIIFTIHPNENQITRSIE